MNRMDISDVIAEIAARLPENDRHVPFMRLVLGWSYYECAVAKPLFANTPLSEAAMCHIAENWDLNTPEGENTDG